MIMKSVVERVKNLTIFRWWLSFSKILGIVYATLILTFFYISVGSIGIFFRLSFFLKGKRGSRPDTYWIDRHGYE